MWELLSCRDLSSWQTVLVHSKPDVGTYIAVSSGILHRCTPHEPFEVMHASVILKLVISLTDRLE
jgi:hypothetical protein